MVVWEFQVQNASQSRFEELYGPSGAWAKLFARDPAFLRTELQRDLRQPGRYLTFDYWTAESSYDQFHTRYQSEYDALDRKCENLTERETLLGRFALVP
jgi:hypothetical protein